MALGISKDHSESYSIKDLTREQFLAMAVRAVEKLNWSLTLITEYGLSALTPKSSRSQGENVTVIITNDLATISSTLVARQIHDGGKNEENVSALMVALNEIKSTAEAQQLRAEYENLKHHFSPASEIVLTAQPRTFTDKLNEFFILFKPVRGYFVTPLLINLNILIFILMCLSGVDVLDPSSESLLEWGANYRDYTLNGEWWRLLTCCFLHIGIFHLLLNMYALVFIGALLEPLLGRTRFFVGYLLTGITASVASIWWHSNTVSAGASGAIFGMYGVFLALLTTSLIERTERKQLLNSIGIFVGYNLLYGLRGNVDNAAHLGGLIGGIIVGYSFLPGLRGNKNSGYKFATVIATSLIVLICSFVMLMNISNDIQLYRDKMAQFSQKEDSALAFYRLPQTATKTEMLSTIKDKGIQYWKENIELLNSIQDLEIPEELLKRNATLMNYCRARVKCYNCIYKAIDENSVAYQDSIAEYNEQIEGYVRDLTE